MKMAKRIMAMLLAVLMVMTGIYYSETEGSVAKAETSTDLTKEMLNVKFQTAQTKEADDTYVMRFVSSVDSLDYSKVGFEVSYADGNDTKTKSYETNTVYERIKSELDSVAYTFSPKVVDTSSEYFVTAKMYATAGVDYTVRAYVITLDGNKIYGPSRCVAVEDGLNTVTTVNASFENTSSTTVAAGDSIKANSYDATVVAVSEDGMVHVRINVDPDALASATKFAFTTSSSTALGSTIHRNLYTSHVPETGTTPVSDTTWYDVYGTDETEFVVATGADLYGIASLANKTSGYETFAGKTIYLVSDVDLQPNGENILWTPIGYMSKSGSSASTVSAFHGTFDGQMHKISDMKVDSNSKSVHGGASWYLGFFGVLNGATVKNFELINGTVTGAYNAGGLAGQAFGATIKGVHVDVDVTLTGGQAGGISGTGTGLTIENCWNSGNITVGSGQYVGGIMGILDMPATTIKSCLNTGKITVTSGQYAGGFVGFSRANVELRDSLSTGIVSATNAARTGLGMGCQNGTEASLINMNETSVVVVKGDSSYKALGLNYGLEIVSDAGTTLSATTCMKTVSTIADITGLAGYTGTGLTFDRPESKDIQEGYWVVGTSHPELKSFSSSDNSALLGQFRTDTRWASVVTVETIGEAEVNTYKIKTAEELLGLASLVNASTSTSFEGEVIYLENDLTFNTGTKADAVNWSNGTGTDNLFKGWTAIGYRKSGTDYKQFMGTFDGQGHSISGIYSTASYGNGLFAYPTGCTIKNVSLVNSYIQGGEGTGSIAGWYAGGTFDTIYSNAIVKAYSGASKNHAGGLFALLSANATVTNCWFDGTVTGAKYVGGITSYTQADIVLTDCMNTGSAISTITTNSSSNYSHCGGLVGYVAANASFVRCFEAGDMTGYGYTGNAVGLLGSGKTLTTTDCYFVATGNIIGGASGTVISNGTTLASGGPKNNPGVKITDESTIYGAGAYDVMTALSFERTDVTPVTTGTWVARPGKIPALKSFVDVDDRL